MTNIHESPPTMSNVQVAHDLNLSPSGVSRLRTGGRFPSLEIMQKIEEVYGWSVQQQADARRDRAWHPEFQKKLQHIYETDLLKAEARRS